MRKMWSVAALALPCFAGPATAETTSYTYDALGRLTNASGTAGTSAAYQYDPAGNRTQLTTVGPAGPTAANDSLSVIQTQTVTFDPLSNDSNGGSGSLTITAVGAPSHGLAIASNGATRLTYTPASGYTGSDSFTYTISNGAATATATVSVSVTTGTLSRNLIGSSPCGGWPYTGRDRAFELWETLAAPSYFGGPSGITPVVTTDQAVGPDGTNTADLVVFERPVSAAWSLMSTYCGYSGNTGLAALSFYVKAADAGQVGKQINAFQSLNANPPTPLATVTLTSDWQWVSVPIGSVAGMSNFVIGLMSTDYSGGTSATGQVKVLLWGAQLLDGGVQQPFAS